MNLKDFADYKSNLIISQKESIKEQSREKITPVLVDAGFDYEENKDLYFKYYNSEAGLFLNYQVMFKDSEVGFHKRVSARQSSMIFTAKYDDTENIDTFCDRVIEYIKEVISKKQLSRVFLVLLLDFIMSSCLRRI